MRPTRALLRTGRAIWLLEIDALGRTWRWASEPVDVTDARAGETWPYAGGLPRIELAVAVDPGQPVAEPQPVTIDLTWPDVLPALARGVVLRGPARLSWWVVGSDYQERLQLLTGTISASEHDYSGAPVRVTVASDIADEGGLRGRALGRLRGPDGRLLGPPVRRGRAAGQPRGRPHGPPVVLAGLPRPAQRRRHAPHPGPRRLPPG